MIRLYGAALSWLLLPLTQPAISTYAYNKVSNHQTVVFKGFMIEDNGSVSEIGFDEVLSVADVAKWHRRDMPRLFGVTFDCSARRTGYLTDCHIVEQKSVTSDMIGNVRQIPSAFRLNNMARQMAHRESQRLVLSLMFEAQVGVNSAEGNCVNPICVSH